MKLTNTQRDAYVRAVMNDMPVIDYDEQARKLAHEAILDLMPPRIRDIAEDSELADALHIGIYLAPGNLSTIHDFKDKSRDYAYDDLRDKAPALWKELQTLAARKKAQRDTHDALEEKLRACAKSATTHKALAELLPEFAKYLPVRNTPCKNLPAVANVMTDFIQAGWPRQDPAAGSAA